MNLLFFSPYFYPYQSGLTRYPSTLFKLLKHHKFTVLTFAHKKNLAPKEIINNLTILRLPYRFKFSKGFISPQSISYFQNLPVKNYDGLILNLPSAEGLPLAHQVQRNHLPILAIYHCDVSLGNDPKSRVISWALKLAVNNQLKIATHVVTNTLDYSRSRPSYPIIKNKLTAIIPPISPPVVNKTALHHFEHIKKNQIWLGIVGRLAAEKNIETIIHAVTLLKQPNIYLSFAGPQSDAVVGESAYAQKMKALLKSEHVPNHQLGFIDEIQLGAYYQTLNVLVLASNNSTESLGLSQIEAMKVGTPVIASNLPGIRYPVSATGMGQLVSPNDPQDFAQAINQVIKHRSNYTAASLQAKALQVGEPHATIKAYENIFHRTFTR